MKVCLDKGEEYPVYTFTECKEHDNCRTIAEIDRETFRKWQKICEDYNTMQRNLHAMYWGTTKGRV